MSDTAILLRAQARGLSYDLGPFRGAVRIGSDPNRCEVSTQEGGLQPVHAELLQASNPWHVIIRPAGGGARSMIWRRGEWQTVLQDTILQSGEQFCLVGSGSVNFQVLIVDAPTPAPSRFVREGSSTGSGRLIVGALLALALACSGVAGIFAMTSDSDDDDRASRQGDRRAVRPASRADRKAKRPEDNEFLETEFVKNLHGDASREMDRWAPISGPNNYRAAKIHSKAQLELIVDRYEIKHIVNLARDSMKGQSDKELGCGGTTSPCEPLWAEELGVEFHAVYLTSKPPEPEAWLEIRDLLEDGDVLVHCTHGVDRTGAVVARWERETHPDTSNEDILEYTYSFGGQWKLSGQPNRFLEAWMME